METPTTLEAIEKRIQNKINRLEITLDKDSSLSNNDYLVISSKQLGLIELLQELNNFKHKLIKNKIERIKQIKNSNSEILK